MKIVKKGVPIRKKVFFVDFRLTCRYGGLHIKSTLPTVIVGGVIKRGGWIFWS